MSFDIEQFLPIFITEAHDHLALIEESMSALESGNFDKETIDQLFRSAHTLKGGAGMYNLDRLVNVAHEAETLLDKLRNGEMAVDDAVVALLFEAQDWLGLLVQAIESGDHPDADEEKALVNRIVACYSGADGGVSSGDDGGANIAPDSGQSGAQTLSIRSEQDAFRMGLRLEPIVRELEDLFAITSLEISYTGPTFDKLDPTDCHLHLQVGTEKCLTDDDVEEVFAFAAGVEADLDSASTVTVDEPEALSPESNELEVDAPVQTDPNPEASSASKPTPEPKAENKGKMAQYVKVNVEKLDRLVDEMGELLTTKARLSVLAQRYHDRDIEEALEEFEKSMNQIRDASLSLRLIPLNETFMRFNRIVREAARATGKDIKLNIFGGETELDRITAEKIVDPLIHIIRNSCDHGIESAEERLQVNKPAAGTIQLGARYQGDHVLITVTDDGKGLQKERILAKAIEKGLVSESDELDDKHIYQLVFHPGFSTAEKVTDLSGRGVGMDVVRRYINELGGQVSIDSKPGDGTNLSIELPLTTAILDGFAARIGDQTVVIPLTHIVECIPRDQFAKGKVNEQDCLFLRGEYIPTIDVGRRLGLPEPKVGLQECLIVESQFGKLAVVLDELHGEIQSVVKTMGPILGVSPFFSGIVTLGTGDLGFVLDVNAFVNHDALLSETY